MELPKKTPSVWVVVPAYNEATVIRSVISEIRSAGFTDIIVVNDGSMDDTQEKASAAGAITLKHLLNRGKGAAVKTGIEAAKELGADIVVTLDGDGQHDPADIAPMIALVREGYDVVLGSRLKNCDGMPAHKIAHNHIGNFLVWMVYGLWVTDSQSGFRVYSKKALELIDTKTDRYEYDSEVIREIKHHQLKFIELPIKVRYTEYSMGKAQKMNLKNGIKTLIKMILSSS